MAGLRRVLGVRRRVQSGFNLPIAMKPIVLGLPFGKGPAGTIADNICPELDVTERVSGWLEGTAPMTDKDENSEQSADRIGELRANAERARRLAAVTTDRQIVATLLSYAAEAEAYAAKLEARVETMPQQAMEASGEPSTDAMAALKNEGEEESGAG
jgi:hypothetical protein